MNKILILTFVLAGFIISFLISAKTVFHSDSDFVSNFIADNPENVSAYIAVNDSVILQLNEQVVLPFADAGQLLTVVEFTFQVAQGEMSLDERIPLSAISKFHIPASDENRFDSWLFSLQNKDLPDSGSELTLEAVAKGILKYSAPANAAFLADKMDYARINARIDSLRLPQQDNLFPTNGAALLPFYLEDEYGKDEAIEHLKNLKQSEYIDLSYRLNNRFKTDSTEDWKAENNYSELDYHIYLQQRLPAASVASYVVLFQKIETFPKGVQNYFFRLFEGTANVSADFKFAGSKTTRNINSIAHFAFARDANGNKIEMILVFHDLLLLDAKKLDMGLKLFENEVFTNIGSYEFNF